MIAIDTNVLVYAHRAESELHMIALEHLRRLCEANQPWALPVPCLSEFFSGRNSPKSIQSAFETYGSPGLRQLRHTSPGVQTSKAWQALSGPIIFSYAGS